MSPQAYSIVTRTPKGTRLDETTPQSLQFVPQPSATEAQSSLKACTARLPASSWLTQGAQAQRATSPHAIQITAEDFPDIALLSFKRRQSLLPGSHSPPISNLLQLPVPTG